MFSFPALSKKLLTVLVISAALTVTAAAAEVSLGTVDASALNLRSAASSSAPVLVKAPKGDKVIILDQEGNWYRVSYQYKEGYMSAEYVIAAPKADFTPVSAMVAGSVVNMRVTPSTSGNILCQIRKGTPAEIVGVEGGWFRVKYSSYTGYIHPDYIRIQKADSQSAAEPAAAAASDSADSAQDETASAAASTGESDLRNQVIDYAKQYLGTKYAYGGRSPSSGFDCSGFVYYVFKHFGYTLRPGASTQMEYVDSIKKDELLPGDLVFFNTGNARSASHVGIYVGDNKFIHAVSYGKKLSIDSLSESYYSKYYVGSGRVLS